MSRTRQFWLCAIAISAAVAIGSSLVGGQQPSPPQPAPPSAATGSLETMSKDANQWVMPLGNYSGTRHSALNQINAQNANRLQVAWTMSTGALRGHEGQPLVIGNMMYVVSAFPIYIYAIDLNSFWQMAHKMSSAMTRSAMPRLPRLNSCSASSLYSSASW